MVKPTSRVSKVLMTGPLVPFADAYGSELKRRGYTAHTAVNQQRQVERLSRWLVASGVSVGELNAKRIEEFVAATACRRAPPALVLTPGTAVLARRTSQAGSAGGRGAGARRRRSYWRLTNAIW